MKIAAAVVIAAAGTLLAPFGPRTAAVPGQGSRRTLLTTRGAIVSFAQDGSELAWVERPGAKPCRRILHLRSLRSGQETTARIGCGGRADLALAGRRVLWTQIVVSESSEQYVDVLTIGPGERRSHRLERVHVDFAPPDCSRLDRICRPQSEPVVAGAGAVLAYTTPGGVRRVVHGARRAFASFPTARTLVVSQGRVLALRSELRPGDGCGCASVPAWLSDGTVEYLSHSGAIDQRAELTRVAPDGSGRQVLTNDGRFRRTLDASADGTRIAYGYVSSSNPLQSSIAVAAPDGSAAHDLGQGGDPAWSPDGTRLAFDRRGVGSTQIYVMDADGRNVTQLTQGADSGGPAWSPDGTKIAYVVDGGISVMRSDGSDAHSLGLAGSSPDWSPDGSRLVFETSAGISIANADGSDVRLVLAGGGTTPRWSPDGRWIVFGGGSQWWDVEYRHELYLVHPDGSGLRPLTFSDPAGWASPAEVRDARGRLVSRFELPGMAYDAVLGRKTSALIENAPGSQNEVITLFNTATGARQRSWVLGPAGFTPLLVGISDRWLVVQVGRVLRGLDLITSTPKTLAVATTDPVGVSLTATRLAWAENLGGHGRIRALTLPR